MSTITRALTDIQGVDVGAPTENSLTATGMELFASDAAYVASHPDPGQGEFYFNTTSLVVREYNGTAWQTNKVLFETENNTALTGANQEITPGVSQIIKLSNASLTSIRGVNPSVQKFLILVNGTGATITIKNEDSGASSATYRIVTGTGVDLSVKSDASIILAYDENSSRWRVTGGSGSGGGSSSSLNVVTSPNDTVTQYTSTLGYGWYSSAVVAASTTTTEAECPLYPVVTTAIKLTRTTVGSYDAWRWKMPTGMKNNTIPVSWLQNVQTGAVSGEWKLDIYTYPDATYTDGAKTRKTLRSDSSSVTSIPGYNGFYGSGNGTSFDSGSETYYEARWTRVSGTNWLSLANVKIGFGDNGIAASQGEWETTTSFTIGAVTTAPTPGTGATFLRNTYKAGRWAIIRYEFKQAVAGSAGTGDYLLPLPTNLSIDYSRAGTTGPGNHAVGIGKLTTSSSFDATGMIANSGSYTNKIFVTYQNETVGETGWGSGGSSLASTNVSLSITVRVPIVGWDDSVLVGPGTNVEYLSSSFTSFSADRSPLGTVLPTTTPATISESIAAGSSPWVNPQQQRDQIRIEIDLAGLGKWVEVGNTYIEKLRFDGTNYIGIGYYWNSSGFFIYRGKYAAGTTEAWSTVPAGTRYRIVKANPSCPVGIEHGQLHGGAQLYKAGYAPGYTGGAIGSGYVGETVSATARAGTGGSAYTYRSTTTWGTSAIGVVTATLNKGLYLVSAASAFVQNGTGQNSQAYYAIGGVQVSNTYQFGTTASNSTVISLPMIPVIITTDGTTVALALANSSGTVVSANNELSVVRIA